MVKGDVQYLADSLLLEKLATIEYGLTKNAGLIDMFSSLFSSIKNDIAEKVNKNGLLPTLAGYLTEGAIISLLGFWGTPIAAAASLFGFDIGDFATTIFNSIKDRVENGESINLNEINQKGRELGKAAHNDMFYILRKAEFEGSIVKNGGMLDFFLKGKTGKSLVVAIITWVIKSILIGAGVSEGTSAVKHEVAKHIDPSEDAEQTQNSQESAHPIKVNLPPIIPNSFNASGDGNQYHINDGSTVWVVPLLNQSIEKTLIWWTMTIYPELKGHESELTQSNSFNNMVSTLRSGIEENHPDYLTIPQGLHSRKDVVDRFAGAVKLKDVT